MTERGPDVAELLKGLGQGVVPVEAETIAQARRARAIPRIETVIRAVPRERDRAARRQRIVGGLAVAATILLMFGAARLLRGGQTEAYARLNGIAGSVTVRDARGEVRAVAPDMVLVGSDELVTAKDARATLVAASGAAIEVASGSAVRLVPGELPNESVSLAAGSVSVRVPKLGPGGSFSVRTKDVEVVVHGTAFEVSVCERCGGSHGDTAVTVSEGVVVVRHDGVESPVRAGERFPDDVPPRAAELEAPSTPTTSASSVAPPTAAPPSTLKAQVKLFQQAQQTRTQGNDARALKLFDEFLRRYPTSELVQEARVERQRCLERLGKKDAAAAEARRYLEDYPDGFARDEAKARALPPSGSASARP